MHLNLHQTKRRHPPKTDNELTSSSEDDAIKPRSIKPPTEKKIKPRVTPPTSDSEANEIKMNDMKIALPTGMEIKSPNRVPQPAKDEEKSQPQLEEAGESSQTGKEKNESDSDAKPKGEERKKSVEEKKDEEWKFIEDKRNIGVGDKVTKGPFRFDYLGDEVDQAEADALSALNSFWLNSIAKKAAIIKTDIPEEHRDFYNKYCNGTRKLNLEVATRLMTYPHVIAITLKSNAKIEVITSDTEKALQESAELRENPFEVVAAMGMHLF